MIQDIRFLTCFKVFQSKDLSQMAMERVLPWPYILILVIPESGNFEYIFRSMSVCEMQVHICIAVVRYFILLLPETDIGCDEVLYTSIIDGDLRFDVAISFNAETRLRRWGVFKLSVYVQTD